MRRWGGPPISVPMRRHLLAVPFAILLGACGGGATLTGGVYADGEARYRIGDLGEGWDRIGVDQNDLAWHHDALEAVVQVNSTCDPFQDVPLTSLTNHLLIGFTDREWVSSDRVPMDGREALRSHVRARLDGVPRELLLYVMKKDECTYDFALVTHAEAFDEASRVFERFVGEFSTDVGTP